MKGVGDLTQIDTPQKDRFCQMVSNLGLLFYIHELPRVIDLSVFPILIDGIIEFSSLTN